jgi:hypothetical protein
VAVRLGSWLSLLLLVLVALVAVSDRTTSISDSWGGDEASLSACDNDEVVITPLSTPLPPRHPSPDFRFEPPLQAGRLVVHDVFRPPTSLFVI